MRKLAGFLLVLVMSFSCIENDIPYPIIVADITSFEVEGQTKCDIDNKSRNVAVEVDESVELSKLKLRSFVVSNDAEIVPTPSEYIDLSEPKTFKLVTYQEYLWNISAKQQIERFFKVTGQVGASIFDLVEKSVLVTMPESADLANLDVIDAKFEKLGSVITPDPKSVKNFRDIVSFNVKLVDTTYTWDVIVVKTESKVATGSVNAYAKYAVVSGAGQSGMKDPYFEYRKETDSNWTKYTSNVIIQESNFTAVIEGLEPQTTYKYRAVLGEDFGEEKTFTTEAAAQVGNSSFDSWYKDDKTWYANVDLTPANYWWDSGNKATNILGEKNPTSPEESVVIRGKSVKLASTAMIGVLAAGSIYTGKFKEIIGIGAKLSFGIPFTSRPKGFKGYYNYTPGIIDKSKEPYKELKGQIDTCQIYAVLADWDEPFEVNTTTGKLIDFNDKNIIAYCQLKCAENTNGYREFNMDFNYKYTDRIPKYIVLLAASSRYGDYFTGSTSSVLYVDEFELVY